MNPLRCCDNDEDNLIGPGNTLLGSPLEGKNSALLGAAVIGCALPIILFYFTYFDDVANDNSFFLSH